MAKSGQRRRGIRRGAPRLDLEPPPCSMGAREEGGGASSGEKRRVAPDLGAEELDGSSATSGRACESSLQGPRR
jgi:hypothetical protein